MKHDPLQQTRPVPHCASPVQALHVVSVQIGLGLVQVSPQEMVFPHPSGTSPQSTPDTQVVLVGAQHSPVPLRQTCPVAQHPVLQVWRGLGQMHCPFGQVSFVLHVVPQVPQLVGEVFARQLPLQQIRPVPQLVLLDLLVKVHVPVAASQSPSRHGPPRQACTDVGAPQTPF